MTRTGDEFVSLETRSQRANENKVDVFVSIHINSNPDPKATGTEFYFQNQVPTDEESAILAKRENEVFKASPHPLAPSSSSDVYLILDDLAHSDHMRLSEVLSEDMLGMFKADQRVRTREIRQAPFHVLAVNAPSTLIELGFLTNDKDFLWLIKPETHVSLAKTIYHGLKKFKETLDKTHR